MENGLNMDMVAVCQKRAEMRKETVKKRKELKAIRAKKKRKEDTRVYILTAFALILATAFICFFWEYATLNFIVTLAVIGLYESVKFILSLVIKLVSRLI